MSPTRMVATRIHERIAVRSLLLPAEPVTAHVRRCGVLLVLAAAFAFAALVQPAHATITNFCPPFPSQVLINANDRCASAQFNYLTQVFAELSNGSGVDHCAVGKQYSGGLGNNVISPVCGTGQLQQTACVSPRVGYATIVNRSASAHFYKGYAQYSNCTF